MSSLSNSARGLLTLVSSTIALIVALCTWLLSAPDFAYNTAQMIQLGAIAAHAHSFLN
jgi:hypothetical protein